MTTDLLKLVAQSPAVVEAVHVEEQRILDQRIAAVAELERLRAENVITCREAQEAVDRAKQTLDETFELYKRAAIGHQRAIGVKFLASSNFDRAALSQENILRGTAAPELEELLRVVARVEGDARTSFRSKTVGEVMYDRNGDLVPAFRPQGGQVQKTVNNSRQVDAILANCKVVRAEVEKLTLSALPKAEML